MQEIPRNDHELERFLQEGPRDRKCQAERAVIEAAVVWRQRKTGEHCEFEALAAAIDRLIALG